MSIKFEDLPEQFDRATIVGETRTAFCYANRNTFVLRLDDSGENLTHIIEARPLDNINLSIDLAQWPLRLHNISREHTLVALRKRSQQLLPCVFLRMALDDGFRDELRQEALELVGDIGSMDVSQFVRCRLLSGLIIACPDTVITKALCKTLGYNKLVPLLDEVEEVAPYLMQTETMLKVFVFGTVSYPQETIPILLDGGLAMETALGMARKDFSGLDAVIEKLSCDPDLLDFCPQMPTILRRFSAS